ncbi:MAG: response regulator [Candidatus Adiutrix sp.]|jgi:DNA-binding response OmpR family regulator|nr:response regulator [Candidatus Adiutrix sp.]
MARIILSLNDEKILKEVEKALAETRHEVRILGDLSYEQGLKAVADRIMAETPDVVIMDYWPEDAASVKLMQTATDLAERPEFILIENEENTGREQVLMALNEGARAFLPHKFQIPALLNYVERSISGPGRLRFKALENYVPEAAVNRLEKQLGVLRGKSHSFQKLIAHLLINPVIAQARKTLVVSDSPYQLELLKKILDDHNFQTLTASNPDDGLNIAMKERPHIIVSDLELEGQTGLDFCQAVKFTHRLIPCYFIICTANQDKIEKVMTPGNGVDDCLVKSSGQNDTMDFVSRVALGLLL